MSIEIKELVIRAVVPATGTRGAPAGTTAPAAAATQEAIVEAAVREVLRILRQSKER